MSRRKDDEIVEKLEAEIKTLKSIVRGLQKQLKKEQKRLTCNHEDMDFVKDDTQPRKVMCENCGRGELQETRLGSRLLTTCTICSYRKSTLKDKNG